MADTVGSRTADPKSPLKQPKVVRSQKIIAEPQDESDASSDQSIQLPRSHTPGYLSGGKSESATSREARRRVPSELSIRQRSQSTTYSTSRPSTSSGVAPKPPPALSNGGQEDGDGERLMSLSRGRSALTSRSASAIASHPSSSHSRAAPVIPIKPNRGPVVPFPPLQDPKTAPEVPPAPASGMYWSKAPVSGTPHPSLRAHTTTLIGSNIYIFGGCDSRTCFNELWVVDADSFYWSRPQVTGEIPMPLRAMTCTAVGKKLVVFGGGDGPAYYNDVYVLDTANMKWTRPRILGDKMPSKRRAHTACLYKNGIYVFGGGDGVRALNDIWRLDVSDLSKMSWRLISNPERTASGGRDYRPKARGYHTANMVGSKLIIFGGSDGGECFDDVWVYDVDTHVWKAVHIPVIFRRLSHTATPVGSYLFVIGGHDGNEYSNDILLLNLVTMTWDRRKAYGRPPTGRGYHGVVLYDSRLIIIGGFDGSEVFDDVMILELAVHSYYSQISHFSIEV
ncbi:hypothetical protein N3K66_005647 [Trichothecium roseum]|uniref:Uncharacterized protein n=1 Tax=Trichothecium roseum TaxID=47278 RepID=A0ACC0UYZ0_9HYPO|nr:hypothetical protein N3K66_005647 [Trichothecium roseum]